MQVERSQHNALACARWLPSKVELVKLVELVKAKLVVQHHQAVGMPSRGTHHLRRCACTCTPAPGLMAMVVDSLSGTCGGGQNAGLKAV